MDDSNISTFGMKSCAKYWNIHKWMQIGPKQDRKLDQVVIMLVKFNYFTTSNFFYVLTSLMTRKCFFLTPSATKTSPDTRY
jgi:hypothetical protein